MASAPDGAGAGAPRAAAAAARPAARFIDALSFEGPRPGYFFGTGDDGTGYYRDRGGGGAGGTVASGSMPPPPPRRPRAHDGAAYDNDDPTNNKRARLDPNSDPSPSTRRGQDLLARAEAEAGGEDALADLDAAAPTDARACGRLLAALDKRVADNVRLRARHPDEPLRFLDSEVDILAALRALAGLAASPELYGLLYKGAGGGGAAEEDGGGAAAAAKTTTPTTTTNKHLETVLGLLAHDNADIGCEVLSLLQELTDTDEGGAVSEQEAAQQRRAARALARAVVAAGGLELVSQRVTTLDEASSEEAQGISAALALVDNVSTLLGAEGALAVCRADSRALLRWQLARVKKKGGKGGGKAAAAGAASSDGPDPIKLQAAEVLASMLMAAEGVGVEEDEDGEEEEAGGGAAPTTTTTNADAASVAQAVVAAGGVDALLRAAAPFRARDPDGAEEAELLENCFGALAALLSAAAPGGAAARRAFLADEGVELCLLMLKSRRACRLGALRALDFAATRCPSVCRAVVDQGGLGALFGIFMGRSKLLVAEEEEEDEDGEEGGEGGGGGNGGKKKKKKGKKKKKARMALDRDGERELEERTVSLLASLFCGLAAGAEEVVEGGDNCGGNGTTTTTTATARLLDRLCAKFVESEHEKLDRLVELLMRHAEGVERAERQLEQEAEEEDEEGAPSAAERALARLEGGEFSLQCCACCAAFLWASGDASLRSRLLSLLHLRGRTLQLLREGVRERVAALEEAAEAEGDCDGSGGGSDDDARERARELRALKGALESLMG
jgi:beta-catenin-like protein 1